MGSFHPQEEGLTIMEIRSWVELALTVILAGLLAWTVWGRRKQIETGDLPDIDLYFKRTKASHLRVMKEE